MAFVSNVSGFHPHALQCGKLWHNFDCMTLVKHRTVLSMHTTNDGLSMITAMQACKAKHCGYKCMIFTKFLPSFL